jgi:hypothetical protein
MFHLPGSSRRSELMIIYGEELDAKEAGAAKDGTSADEQRPALAVRIREHAASGMRIEKQ